MDGGSIRVMSSSTHDDPAGVPVAVDRAGVLGAVRGSREAEEQAAVAGLRAAVDWAMMHASWDWDQSDHSIFEDEMVPLAGPGAPLISADCVAEYAAVSGLSPQSGRTQLAVAVELRYRLRRLYERVLDGAVPVWRARWIAERTLHLTQAAADAVDRLLAPYAGSVSFAQMDRTIAEAIARHDPQAARKREEQAVEQTGVWFHHPDPTLESQAIASLDARLDATDALDLTPQSPPAPRRWPTSAPPSRWMSAALRRWPTWPAPT